MVRWFLVGVWGMSCAVQLSHAAPPPSFAPRVDYATAVGPSDIALGDLNGDGIPDMVVSDYDPVSNKISVRLGTGAGAFGPKTDYATGINPFTVAIGNLNAGGVPDVVVSNWSGSSVSVFLGAGGGALGAKTDFSTGSGRPIAAHLVDLNLDGKLDIILCDWTTNQVKVLTGNGLGGFAAATSYAAGSRPYSLALGDLNADGRLDVVVANRSTTSVSILLGQPGGGFGAPSAVVVGSDPISVELGDLDGDGDLDLTCANFADSSISRLMGTGTGAFISRVDLPLGASPLNLALRDMDQDGHLDVVTSYSTGTQLTVLSGTGTGAFLPPVNFGVPAGPARVTVADIDLVGNNDVAVAAYTATAASVLLNTTAAPGQVPSAGNSTIPTLVTAGPDGACCFDVTVRDLANNPIPGSSVTVSFAACSVSFCPTQPAGVFVNVPALTASVITNAAGVAHMCVCVESPLTNCSVSISADGVELGNNVVAGGCLPDSTCTPGAWKLAATQGPEPRFGNAMASVTNHYSVLLFGGMGAGSTLLGDTWAWNGISWSQKSPAHSPSPRYGHAMAYDHFRDRVVLFGGTDASGVQGDTWEWDGADWTLVSSSGPAARSDHMMAYDFDHQKTVLYGGSPLRSDMWQWDGTAWTSICGSCSPGARERATMAYDLGRGRTFLFGGVGSGGTDLSQWVWDGANWAHVPSGSPLPLPATAVDQATTYANSCNSVVLFGGGTGGDTWTWNGAYWIHVPTSEPQRVRYAMAYDLFQDRPMIFGGYDPSAGPTSLSQGTWEWCSPCSTPLMPTDSLGNGIYPTDDGPVADADTAEVIHNGVVSSLYPGYDTSTNAWYSQYPCNMGFGGDEDPADEDEDPQAELDTLGLELTPEALRDSMSTWNQRIGASINGQPSLPLGAVGVPYNFPPVPHCPDRSAPYNYVLGGRDIIFVHGFRTEPLQAAILGTNDSARVAWQQPTHFPGDQENPDFYGNGYWKLGAERYWRDHVKHFLTDRGNYNRYLIVSWPVTQRLEVAIQCVLTQISDAMHYGTGVVDPTGNNDCSNFGTPNFVVISHSTGGLLTSAMMRAAVDHVTYPNLQADFIPELCKGEVALNGAITGSNEALALAVAAGAGGNALTSPVAVGLCKVVNILSRFSGPDVHRCPGVAPAAQLPCASLPSLNLSYVFNGVTMDLIPSVAVGKWGPVKDLSPIRTVTMSGGHPTTYGNIVKHHILMGLDDGVVNLQNASANPEPLTSAYGYWGRKRDIKDKGLKHLNMKARMKGYFRDQWKDADLGGAATSGGGGLGWYLVGIGANEKVAPWGMVQPDHVAASTISVCSGPPSNCIQLEGHDPNKRYNNHFSFMESASHHYGTTPSWDLCPPFTGPNGELYEWTGSDADTTQANNEETLAITDGRVFDNFSMPRYPDDSPMLKRNFPQEVEDVVRVAKKRKKNGKTAYKWSRTYHRAQGWESKVLGDYMYECVLSDPPPPCPEVCCVRPPNGLLAWWPGDSLVNAFGADRTLEVVAPRAQGVLVNGTTVVPGKVGTAFEFDGLNDYVNVADKPKLRLGNAFTLQAWIYSRDAASTGKVILDKGMSSAQPAYRLQIDAGRPVLQLRTSSCSITVPATSSPSIADTCWHHLVVTRQGATVKMYVDGVIVLDQGGVCLGSPTNTLPLHIGGLPADPASCFAGMIDEVAMWSRALPPAQVQALFAAGREGMCHESWWVPSVVHALPGQTQVNVKPVICNLTKSAFTANYLFSATPVGGTCTAPGPTAFSPAGGSQFITAGTCVTLPVVHITLPPGMAAGSQSCYQMRSWFRENQSPACYRVAKGRVVRGRPGWDVGPGTDVVSLVPNDAMVAAAQGSFDITNPASPGSGIVGFGYRVTVVPTDGDTTGMATFQLNGLPPGVPYVGVANVAGGATTRVQIAVDASNLTGDRFYDLVFAYDMDGDAVPDEAAVVGMGDFADLALVGVGPEAGPKWESLRWVRTTPNPFTESSAIEFELASPGWVAIQVYDVAGRRVRDLSRVLSVVGAQRVQWDGRDESGHVADSGVYMVRVRSKERTTTTKALLVRQRR